MHTQRKKQNRIKAVIKAAMEDEENVLIMMSSPLVFIHLACLATYAFRVFGLKILERLGLIWDLRRYPHKLFEEAERLKLEKEATPA